MPMQENEHLRDVSRPSHPLHTTKTLKVGIQSSIIHQKSMCTAVAHTGYTPGDVTTGEGVATHNNLLRLVRSMGQPDFVIVLQLGCFPRYFISQAQMLMCQLQDPRLCTLLCPQQTWLS